ncbi:P-loop containing nucleoside triphosphate hydrolase protein [Mycena rosella]|uniref:DNA 3'-5' helicase n=1 Tax=Mycena rosella TaxID=1033263 RepID=A0AAD7DYS1_MYCRO|nr:P-loop containing nucleoside triphosphate hydrolase protein [Mycena rosella]
MDSDCEFPEYLTQDNPDLDDSSSALHTPPAVSYTNLVGPSHSKAKSLRREPSGLVDCHRILTKTFGHLEYKGKQREIVEAAVHGADIFVLAPTGMGKSLCFQIPAVAETHGVTIVVSPLLEVSALREKDITVASFTSETSSTEKSAIVRDLASGHPVNRLLYITPEKLCTADFMQILKKIYDQGELNRLVIDEAHCISEWGHDFRSEYRRLGVFRKNFKNIPIMALTATATPAVQLDIIRSLGMSEDHLVKVTHPFNRANLFYEVRYMSAPDAASQMADIADYIFTLYQRRERPSSGIVYCRTRAACDELSGFLRGKGLSSRPYHRGVPSATLDKTLKEWTRGGAGDGGVDVVCATIAFGLGIDKSDVRYIIHYDLPKSLEGYYQETGRAGRDGSPSKCILYYSREDVIRVKRWVSGSHTKRTNAADRADGPAPSQRAVDSLTSSICRYFGEPIDMTDQDIVRKYCNKMCDICKYPDKTKRRHMKLSSEEYAGTQVPAQVAHYDDDDYPRAGPNRENSNNYSTNSTTVWKKNFRDAEVESNYKRPRAEQTEQPGRYKKSKGASSSTPSYGKALVTKAFRSATDLKKPFKTPFRVPSAAVTAEEPAPEVDVDDREPSPPVLDEDEDDSEPNVQVVEATNTRPSSPIELPDAETGLDVSFSQKIEPSMRHTALTAIRKALHKVFLRGSDVEQTWMKLGGGLDSKARASILDAAAHSLEFTALSMCSTADGYESRTEGTVDAVRCLGENLGSWDSKVARSGDDEEWEDAQAVLVVLRQVCEQG